MSKSRMVNTKFWTDEYILESLNTVDKLAFIYLITNPQTNICGIYELSLRSMAMETGINIDNLKNVILPRFERDGKVLYRNGWVAIKNFIKNQKTGSKDLMIGIERELNNVPKELKYWVENREGGGTVPTPSDIPNLTKLNLTKLNLIKDIASSNDAGKEINELINLFEPINPSYKKFFSNTTQRKSLSNVLKTLGKEKLVQLLKLIPQVNTIKYAPTITTPLQLEDKLAQLIAFLKKEKEEKENNKIITL